MTRLQNILDRIHFAGLTLFLIFSPFSISLTTIALFVGIAAWMFKTWMLRSWAQVPHSLALPFALFIAASLLAIVTAHDPVVSSVQAKKFGEPLIVFWTLSTLMTLTPHRVFSELADTVKRRSAFRFMTRGIAYLATLDARTYFTSVLVLAAAVSGLAGYYQHFIAADVYGPRARGTFGSVNTYAQMMMLSGLLLTGRLLFVKDRRALGSVAFACIAGGMVWTLSRGAWLGFLTGLGFLLLVKSPRVLLGLVAAGVLVLALLPDPMQRNLLHYELDAERNLFRFDQSMQDRVDIWRAALDIFKDHPWTGCGFRCGVVMAEDYPQHPILKQFRAQHSNVLQLLVETGILGLAAWLAIWVVYFKYAFAGWRDVTAQPERAWQRLGGLAAVMGFHTYGLVESNYFDSEVAMLTFFMMGLSLWRPENSSPQRDASA